MSTCTTPGLADALARLAQQRDPQAWAQVLELAGNDCWRCCLAVCGQPAAAEDALQETMLQVRDNARLFKVQGDDADGDARRWLKRVASTTALQLCRTRGRAQRRDQRAGAQVQFSTVPDPAAHLHAADDLAALRDTLAGLDEPRRTAITLHHLQGLTLAEVAAELGRPVGTVKTWIHRGMEELHTLLASRGVTVSLTSLLALFASAQASAATTVMPAAMATSATALLTVPATASVNALALTTSGALPMAIKVSLLIAVATSAFTLVLGQEHRPDTAVPRVATPVPPSAPVAVVPPAVVQVQETPPAPAQEEAGQAATRSKLQQRITCQFVDQDFVDVVSFLRQAAGISVVVAPDVIAGGARKVTLQVKDMPMEDVLTRVCTLTQTHWVLQNQAIFLSSAPIHQVQLPAAAPAVPANEH